MKRLLTLNILSILMLALIGLPGPGWSQVPQTISYQGVLKDNSGNIVANGDYDILFTLYDDAGNEVWSEWHSVVPSNNPVTVTDGLFSVILGKAMPFSNIMEPPYWLGIKIGADAEMTPRIELTAVIYALHADRSDSSDYAQKAGEVSGTDNVFSGSGNVGIGTANPLQKLHVKANSGDSEIRIEGSSVGDVSTASVSFYNSTPTRIGYIGDASSGTDDIYIVADASNALQFYTGGQNRLHITNTGNVGIGTITPDASAGVHIEQGDESATTYGLFVKNTNTSTMGIGVLSNVNFAGGTTHTAFHASAANATNNWAFYGANGNGYFADSLGIGTTNPTAKLEVVGGVKADSILFTTPVERWYAIPAAEFKPYVGVISINDTLSEYHAWSWSSEIKATAGVHLPEGATITGFRAKVEDNSSTRNDSAKFTINLWEATPGSAASSLDQVVSSTTSGVQTLTSSVLSQPVDNQNNTYLVTVIWYAPPSPNYQDLKLYDVRISYTITQPLP